MTIAEQLIKEGMEKGIQEGMQKGIQEGMQKGIQEGMQKGMEKGILEGKRKTAKNFLRLGLSVQQVAEAAELPIEDVFRLKKEIEN